MAADRLLTRLFGGRRHVAALLLILWLPKLLHTEQCTTGKKWRLKSREYEAVVDAVRFRLEHDPGKMKVRRQTVEHPFGTLK